MAEAAAVALETLENVMFRGRINTMLDQLDPLVYSFLQSPDHIWQAIVFFVALALGRVISRYLISRIRRSQSKDSRWVEVLSRMAPIIDYCGAVVVVSPVLAVFLTLTKPVYILVLGLQGWIFAVLFFTLLNLTQNKLLSFLIAVLGFVPWLYHQLGALDQLSRLLNKFSIQVGSVSFTPVTLIKGIILLSILGWGASLVVDASVAQVKRSRRLKTNTKVLLSKSIEVMIYFFAFVLGLRVLGIDLTALTVVGGALGVGIGFGLQKITSNFISGIILLVERSIEVSDLVEMDGGIYGFVRSINARYILIETFDGKEIMVPNEDFVTQRVTNWTFTNSKGRIEVPVGVSYGADIRLAQRLIIEAASEHEQCISDPAPACHLREFGDSSVNFLLYFFVGDVSLGRYQVQSEVMLAIWDKFKENNIEIPFPQRDLHIKSGLKLDEN